MNFNEVVGMLLSVLLSKFFEIIANENKSRILVKFKLVIIAAIFMIITSIDSTIRMIANEKFLQHYNETTESIIFRILIILLLTGANIYIYGKHLKGSCTFNKLSKIIVKFTSQVSDNDILYVFCGDMDVWNGVDDDLQNSKEFQQLKQLQNENRNITIKILCKHCMENDLIDDIINDNYDEENLIYEERFNAEQIKRIAYFKNNLRKCEFRFYKDPKEDYSNLRARIIKSNNGNKVLLYNRENASYARYIQWVFKIFKRDYRYVYNYNVLDTISNSQLLHYVDLCELKWKKCDETLAKKIEGYCLKYDQVSKGGKSNVKKIAFVYAKTYEIAHFGKRRKEFPPFGVMYLAAMVKKECDEWVPEIIAIEENNVDINIALYDVIAFSVISAYTVPVFEKCMDMIKSKKKNNSKLSKVICIAGGFQAEQEAEKWLKSRRVRLVLKGEGEYNIVELLNGEYLSTGSYKNISGAMFLVDEKNRNRKGKKREFRQNPINGSCVDLDTLPFPARELLPEEDYIMNDRLAGTNYKMVHVIFSRGCSYNCAYCGVPREGNRRVRYRRPQNIVDELETLKNSGVEGFSIIDDCFLTDSEKALEIINEIVKVDMKWSLAARVDQITEDIVLALKASGCLEIKFGLETGSDRILSAMNKGFTVDEAKNAINLVRKYGIGVKAFIITGLPGENKETNEETKAFLKEMGRENINRISLLRFVPLPGSYIYEHRQEYGIRKDIKEIGYSCYKLYNGETNWWENDDEFKIRNEIYKDISTFMRTIWDEI